MKHILGPCGLLVLWFVAAETLGAETPIGRGMTEANKERLVLDDMEDISAWSTATPVETTLSRSDAHVKQGRFSLKFANLVDYSRGDKDYPIGWPQVNKDLAKAKLTDWSGYDFLECWIYTETSRAALPNVQIELGLHHSRLHRSSRVELKELRKDAWVKIVVPISKLLDPADVTLIQFSISEAKYRDGDRVDFFIDDVVLTRFVDPAIAELAVERKVLYADDKHAMAMYKLVGRAAMDEATVEVAIGRGDGPPMAQSTLKATRQGEIVLPLPGPMIPGIYWRG